MALPRRRRGAGTVDRVPVERRAGPAACAACRRCRAGSSPMRRSPVGQAATISGRGPPFVVEQLLRAGRSAATPRATSRCAGFVFACIAGTWWDFGTCPRPWLPSSSFGPVQPFGVRSTIIGQRGRSGGVPAARRLLELADLARRPRRSASAISASRSLALDDQRVPAVALEELRQLLVAHRLVDRRVGDLVAVEVQDRQHRAARRRVEELVRVPGAGRRAGLGLAVADDARDDQVRVVERRAERGGERVAELAALVDRAGHDRRQMAREAARPGEAADQPAEARAVAASAPG